MEFYELKKEDEDIEAYASKYFYRATVHLDDAYLSLYNASKYAKPELKRMFLVLVNDIHRIQDELDAIDKEYTYLTEEEE